CVRPAPSSLSFLHFPPRSNPTPPPPPRVTLVWRMRLLPALVVALVLALLAVAWLVLRSGSDGTDPRIATLGTPTLEHDPERPAETLADASGIEHSEPLAEHTTDARTPLGIVPPPP